MRFRIGFHFKRDFKNELVTQISRSLLNWKRNALVLRFFPRYNRISRRKGLERRNDENENDFTSTWSTFECVKFRVKKCTMKSLFSTRNCQNGVSWKPRRMNVFHFIYFSICVFTFSCPLSFLFGFYVCVHQLPLFTVPSTTNSTGFNVAKCV